MNNANGAALLARIKPGALVTIRAIGGGTLTGRAVTYRDATPEETRRLDERAGLTRPQWLIRTGPHTRAGVTAENVTRVTDI